jgi:hypothetical protein
MDTELMIKWIKVCFPQSSLFTKQPKSLLIFDKFGAHVKTEVLNVFKRLNTKILTIPERTTSFLQPLDVVVNSIFKAEYRKRWTNWMANGEKIMTKSGYRKRICWEIVFKWISESILQVNEESVKKAFHCCGIFAKDTKYDEAQFNTNLKSRLCGELANYGDVFDIDFEDELEDFLV